MNPSLRRFTLASVLVALALAASAAEPSRFTFTPKFKDPDPGRRSWERRGNTYVETLPSGRLNTFRITKSGQVNGQPGIIVQKVSEPNFYVFIADSTARRPELWWWRDSGKWNFMGTMENVSAPHNID